MDKTSIFQQPSWTVKHHSLTEAELRLARNWLCTVPSTPRLLAKSVVPSLFVAALTFSLVTAVGFFVFETTAAARHAVGLVGIILAMVTNAYVMQRVFASAKRDVQRLVSVNQSVQKDIDACDGEAINVHCVSVVEIAAVEDEGKKYCFRLSEDTAVMLRISGDDNPDFLVGNTLFPNQAFTVIRLATSKLILKINCMGDALPVAARLPAHVDKYHHRDAEPFKIEWSQLLAGNAQV